MLAKLPKRTIDPTLKGKEKRAAEAALAEAKIKEQNAVYILAVDTELNQTIQDLEGENTMLGEKVRAEAARWDIRALAKGLARTRGVAPELVSSSSEEEDDNLDNLQAAGNKNREAFIRRLLQPPDRGG